MAAGVVEEKRGCHVASAAGPEDAALDAIVVGGSLQPYNVRAQAFQEYMEDTS